MKYNRLGNSDLKVSAIGFGAMSLDLKDSDLSASLIQAAFDAGLNYFDTADLYNQGLNEKFLGQCVQDFRQDIVLATKVGNRWRTDGSGWDWDVSASYIKQAIDDSLRRLGTDYIDLYQIHGGTIQDDFEEVVETLENLVQAGKIRYYGISSIRPNVFTKYTLGSNIVSNMMQFSVLDSRPKKYFPIFEKSEVSVIARGVLAQGLLVDKEPKNYLTRSEEEVGGIQDKIRAYCSQNGISTTSFALKYVLNQPTVGSALIGVRTMLQLKDILNSYHALQTIDIDFESFGILDINYQDHLS